MNTIKFPSVILILGLSGYGKTNLAEKLIYEGFKNGKYKSLIVFSENIIKFCLPKYVHAEPTEEIINNYIIKTTEPGVVLIDDCFIAWKKEKIIKLFRKYRHIGKGHDIIITSHSPTMISNWVRQAAEYVMIFDYHTEEGVLKQLYELVLLRRWLNYKEFKKWWDLNYPNIYDAPKNEKSHNFLFVDKNNSKMTKGICSQQQEFYLNFE